MGLLTLCARALQHRTSFTLSTFGKQNSLLYSSVISSKGADGSKVSKDKEIIAPGIDEYKDPWKILSNDLKVMVHGSDNSKPILPVPRETDIAIIGGGAIGSSVAYWLQHRHPEGFKCHVIERDPTYTRAATVLSVGGLRQQFSLPENIKMSLFTADFIRNIKEHLSIYGVEPPDVQFNPQGYLFLASEKGAETLERNHQLQTELGAKVALLSRSELKEKFPWINVEDIVCGSYGLENEGWFDPWLLLCALRQKAQTLGVEYVKGEVTGFRFRDYRVLGFEGNVINRKRLESVLIKYEDGITYPMRFCTIINCAGPWAGEVARMAGLGVDEGVLRYPLPIEPRKRYVYMVHCPDGPGLETPMVVDPSGVYLRREGLGHHYLTGASPDPDDPDCHETLNVEESFFKDSIYPALSHRVPAFSKLKLKSAWAGYYDYNYFDQNLIIGNHPYFPNMVFANGCSGHGIQHAPAIGRAIMEYILDDGFQTVDLSRFSFDRILDEEPIFEDNIV